MQDVRYALRMMRRSPGFTAVAILSLALGIGLATAVFTVADALLLRRLPGIDQSRLVVLSGESLDRGIAPGTLIMPAGNGVGGGAFVSVTAKSPCAEAAAQNSNRGAVNSAHRSIRRMISLLLNDQAAAL